MRVKARKVGNSVVVTIPKKFKVAVGQLFIARLLENSGGKILFTPIPSKWKLLRHADKHPKSTEPPTKVDGL
ncbi:hypothetical protein SN4111_00630 [Ligilactobacillus agilis]|nr:hypothetical protein SN4111_00630 [Ligilactobacillus agilis]